MDTSLGRCHRPFLIKVITVFMMKTRISISMLRSKLWPFNRSPIRGYSLEKIEDFQ